MVREEKFRRIVDIPFPSMSEEANESNISIDWAPSVLIVSTSNEESSLCFSSIDGSLEIKCID
jgi:hypothetical protein